MPTIVLRLFQEALGMAGLVTIFASRVEDDRVGFAGAEFVLQYQEEEVFYLMHINVRIWSLSGPALNDVIE